MSQRDSLVDCSWLSENLSREDVVVLDGSWHMPATNRDGRAEFEKAHIPGAKFFDIDEVSDQNSPYPHMLPDENFFAQKVSELGIKNDSHIIVYDSLGLFSAARVWWMFRIFGHEKISILNGGLKKWIVDDYPISEGVEKAVETTVYETKLNQNMVVDYGALLQDLTKGHSLVLDARSQGRFMGVDPEPRAELSSGHMPCSVSLPFAKLLEPDGFVKPNEKLRDIFREAGVSDNRSVITTCGSGVTAAILTFGLHLLGRDDVKLYDGSWSEYAARNKSQIIKD